MKAMKDMMQKDSDQTAQLRQELNVAHRAVAELKAEVTALREQIIGDPELSLYFYQRKSARQSAALDTLTAALTRKRFALRVMNELGRGITREEFIWARDQIASEQLRERIGDPDPA